jgi:hypothetical protein
MIINPIGHLIERGTGSATFSLTRHLVIRPEWSCFDNIFENIARIKP